MYVFFNDYFTDNNKVTDSNNNYNNNNVNDNDSHNNIKNNNNNDSKLFPSPSETQVYD